jgi:hypothetical protein
MPVLQPCGQENNNKKEDALSSALPSRISPSILLSAYGRDQPVDPEKNPKSGDQSGERHCSSQCLKTISKAARLVCRWAGEMSEPFVFSAPSRYTPANMSSLVDKQGDMNLYSYVV